MIEGKIAAAERERAIKMIRHRIYKIKLEPGTVVNTLLRMRAEDGQEYDFAYYQNPQDTEKRKKVEWLITQVHEFRHLFIKRKNKYDPVYDEMADLDFTFMRLKMSEKDFTNWACLETGRYHWKDAVERHEDIPDPVFAYMGWILRYGEYWPDKHGNMSVFLDLGKRFIRDLSEKEAKFICRDKQVIYERFIIGNTIEERDDEIPLQEKQAELVMVIKERPLEYSEDYTNPLAATIE